MLISVVAGLASAASASAELRDPHTNRPAARDVDVRTQLASNVAPTAAQRQAARALTGVTVVFDRASGLPSQGIRYGGAITGKRSGSAEAIARGFVADNADLFRLSAAGLARFVVAAQDVTPGFTALTLQQTDAGREVLGARLTIGIDADGRILTFSGSYRADAAADSTAALSAADAVRVALREAGERPPALKAKWSASSPSRRTVFENTVARDIRDPSDLEARLVTFPMPGNRPARLAWKTVTEINKIGAYESVVDADTGALLARRNRYDNHAVGTVFTAQHPDIAGATRTQESFAGASFDNNGWVGSNRETNGNNVNAYQDTDGDDASDFQPQTPAAPDPEFQHFNYAWTDAWDTSGETDITTDQAAVVTQMFYYTNKYHDYFYGLGFDEPSRNFQVDNFGRGGAGGDPIIAEADDSYLTEGCNANFGTPADGSSPLMQMYVGKTSCGNISMQRAMNGDTIFHEISHGLSHRLVSGGSLGGGAQTDAMGEGWGDFMATSYWNDPVYGDYNNGDTNVGIRDVAYDDSDLTYDDHCSGGCQEHDDGQIWATVLWDLRAALITKYGYSADRPDTTTPTAAQNDGNRRAQQLVVDAMKLSGTDPTFLSMRDQILAADLARYAGADTCLIWGVFAEREMGFSATVGANQGQGATATDGPASCAPVADAGGPYTTPEGTDAVLSAAASTNPGTPPLTYEWDLDNDGDYDDATGVSPSFTNVGRDGVFTIGVRVTNADGFSDTATTTVTVTNVAPAVGTIGSNGPRPENTAVTISGAITDPGWEDPLSATINWGDGGATTALTGTEEHVRPDGSITYSVDHTYGDDGTFTVTICAADDDISDICATRDVTVTNVNPTATIDESGATNVNGTPVIFADVGEPVDFSGRATDPGSDDLTLRWNWDDGGSPIDASTTFLVNPPNPDPDPSPSIQPRDVTDDRQHAFGDACLYDVGFSALDDDGGTGTDSIVVLITGPSSNHDKSAGFWENEYEKPQGDEIPAATLACYLEITGLVSQVFHEVNDASTFAKARKIVDADYPNLTAKIRLDRVLLTNWLNFANGAWDWDEPVDTNDDGVNDTTFSQAMQAAEAVRLNPAATTAQLDAQREILQQLDN